MPSPDPAVSWDPGLAPQDTFGQQGWEVVLAGGHQGGVVYPLWRAAVGACAWVGEVKEDSVFEE